MNNPQIAQSEREQIEVAVFNDYFRKTFDYRFGKVNLTVNVEALSLAERAKLIRQVREFSEFESENDPCDEHDFGVIEQNSEKYFWKIDYYDKSLTQGSEDPSNVEITSRVLTIMHSSEY